MASQSDDVTESTSDILSNVLNAVDDETRAAHRFSSPSLSAHLSIFNTDPQPPPATQPTITTPEQPDIMNTKKWGRKVMKADKQEAVGVKPCA
ncbi:hypothetical protein M422DRAFT_249003 [Sphaerobolus stellatus SS14]|nr:hypothetical protein M422DRAFT_249003 [Sphaerobolus stellatus SS14]